MTAWALARFRTSVEGGGGFEGIVQVLHAIIFFFFLFGIKKQMFLKCALVFPSQEDVIGRSPGVSRVNIS